jgi:hypothetical protein
MVIIGLIFVFLMLVTKFKLICFIRWLSVVPQVKSAEGNAQTVFILTLENIPESIYNSKQYHYHVNIVTSKDRVLVDSGLIQINKTLTSSTHSSLKEIVTSSITSTGSLVLDVKITIKFKEDIPAPLMSSASAKRQILSNVSNLYGDEELSDFTFVVRNKKFMVHKPILASASPYFRNIFTTEINESCKIDNIETKIFESLLRFTGQLRRWKNFAFLSTMQYKLSYQRSL